MSSSLLLVIDVAVIVIGVLAVMLLEGKKCRERLKATLDASVERYPSVKQWGVPHHWTPHCLNRNGTD